MTRNSFRGRHPNSPRFSCSSGWAISVASTTARTADSTSRPRERERICSMTLSAKHSRPRRARLWYLPILDQKALSTPLSFGSKVVPSIADSAIRLRPPTLECEASPNTDDLSCISKANSLYTSPQLLQTHSPFIPSSIRTEKHSLHLFSILFTTMFFA